MPTAAELLDFSLLSSRAESVQFDVLDQALQVKGRINPSGTAKIQWDGTRSIMRTLNGLWLTPGDTTTIDFSADLLRPAWKLATGSVRPLGVFAFSTSMRGRHTWGVDSTNTLQDLTIKLAVETKTTTGFTGGGLITTALAGFLSQYLTTPLAISASTVRFGQAAVYPPGTQAYQIVADLCAILGYLPPYFDNLGRFVCRPTPHVRVSSPSFIYAEGGNVEVDTITESDTVLTAPNRYIVIGGGFTTGQIVGSFDVPIGAPNSITNRGGTIVPKVLSMQSVANVPQANVAARAAYVNDPITATSEFDHVADPRRDGFDLVKYNGDNYLGTSWTLDLTHGGTHHSVLRRVYD